MAKNSQWPDETREMRLISQLIEKSDKVPDTSLPQFIARRRKPDSEGWTTWDEISFELRGVIGEMVTDVSLRRWSARYGIPEGTLPNASPVTSAEYSKQIKKSGIALI